ncbi:hypothetical protein, partial [Pseudomonas syringae]|uniref:hypothetical protein n=1 Tax=Pseudomonas syringae TaxID=317 RepID=UPI001CA5DDEF
MASRNLPGTYRYFSENGLMQCESSAFFARFSVDRGAGGGLGVSGSASHVVNAFGICHNHAFRVRAAFLLAVQLYRMEACKAGD